MLGPASANAAFGFGTLDRVSFAPVEFGGRPRPGDVVAVLRLRRLLLSGADRRERPGVVHAHGLRVRSDGAVAAADPRLPDLVHAHGLRAGALSVLGLAGVSGVSGASGRRGRRSRRPALVVTVHNAPPVGGGAPALIYRLLERIVARRADLVLCVSADLEARMRSAGARRTARAIVPSPAPPVSPAPSAFPAPCVSLTPSASGEAFPTGRPVVLAAGRLATQKGFDVLLDAAALWQGLAPVPLLAIAGDGPLAGELRSRAASRNVDAVFLGRRDDVADLLAAAAVFVLPSRWEGQPLIVQEALRAGVPIVATRVGGIPDLVGDDGALLVPPEDAPELAAAVRAVLTDVALATRLRAAASRRAAALPTADDAVASALSAYAQVLKL